MVDSDEKTAGEKGPRNVKRVLQVGLAVIGVVGAVVIVSRQDGDPEPTEPTPSTTTIGSARWEEIDEPDDIEPLRLGAGRSWGADDGPAVTPQSFAVVDEAVVIADGRDGGGYVVADAASGEERWRLRFDEPVAALDGGVAVPRLSDVADADTYRSPLPVSRSGDHVVAVPYRREECVDGCPTFRTTVEAGIAAYSLGDGSFAWKTPYEFPPIDEDGEAPVIYDLTAGGSLVVAAIEERSDDAVPGRPRLQMVGYDAADGSLRWKVGGFAPLAVTDEVVLARRDGRVDDQGEVGGPGLAGFDAETGRQLWSLGEDGTSYAIGSVSGAVAVVAELDPDQGWLATVIDVATGDELADFGEVTRPCATDGETLVACPVEGTEPRRPRVATYRVEDGATGVSAEGLVTGTTIVGVVDGRVMFGDEDRSRSVDRSGTTVDTDLPGLFHTANDSFAVFGCEPTPSADCSDYTVVRLD